VDKVREEKRVDGGGGGGDRGSNTKNGGVYHEREGCSSYQLRNSMISLAIFAC
jgi:hypothetical protein